VRPGLVAAVVVLATCARARADEPAVRLSLEAGSEIDTNPHRVSAAAMETYDPLPAAVARAGARFSLAWRPTPGRVVTASAVAAAKKFIGADDAAAEDVAVLTGDLRYDARVADKPLVWGARLSCYDALERDDGPGGSADHDFRTGDGALTLGLAGEHAQRVTLALGYRVFDYKPDARYDFAGEHVQLEWRRSFEPDDADDGAPEDAGSWDVAAWYGLARRGYDGEAYANVCAPDTELCLIGTGHARVDLAHDAGAEVTYTGERIYSARYQAVALLSNSFGQSLVRHRLQLSATSELWWSVFVTASVVVQLNQFVDSLLLERNTGELTIEDENRNAFTLHATRELGTGAHWAIEARYGFYSNEFATQTLRFRRQTAYLGLVFRL
jgi:hypothetical protein